MYYASVFFLTTRRGFDDVDSAASFFFEEALFNLALIALRFLDTPKEPFERLPFLDFLSPLPIHLKLRWQ
jgi:hypothetical protein